MIVLTGESMELGVWKWVCDVLNVVYTSQLIDAAMICIFDVTSNKFKVCRIRTYVIGLSRT